MGTTATRDGHMGCLTLNASFEPLTILPVERALRLVIDSKAEVLEVDAARVFRSQWEELPCPTVIRLARFVHVPRRFRRQVTNTFLFARDGYRCQYCGRHRNHFRSREFLTRDHVIPVALGGENCWQNVVTACSTCNESSSTSCNDGRATSWWSGGSELLRWRQSFRICTTLLNLLRSGLMCRSPVPGGGDL